MQRRIIINEQKMKFYSVRQLKNSLILRDNQCDEKTDKDTIVNFILEQMKVKKCDPVHWTFFLQELKDCIEIEYIPETEEEVIELLKPYIDSKDIVIEENEEGTIFVNHSYYTFAPQGFFAIVEEDGYNGYGFITDNMYIAYLILKDQAVKGRENGNR